MKFSEYIKEDKPIGKKNKELWFDYLKTNFSKDPKDLYVTFVSEDKVGINPKSRWNTPNGVYTYPLEWVLEGNKIPFRGSSPTKIKVLKSVSDKVLDSSFSEKDLEKCIKKLTPIIEDRLDNNVTFYQIYDDFHNFIKYSEDNASKQTPFGKLWNITRKLSENPNKWSKLLIDLGFDYVVDNGQEIIHENEPTQAVFLNPKSYKVVGEEFIDTENRYNKTNKEYTLREFRQSIVNVNTYKEYLEYVGKNKNNIIKLLKNKDVNIFHIKIVVPGQFLFEFLKDFKKYVEKYLKENMNVFYKLVDYGGTSVGEVLDEFKDEFNVLMANRFWEFVDKISKDEIPPPTFGKICDKLYYGISEFVKSKKSISFLDELSNKEESSRAIKNIFIDKFIDELGPVFDKDPFEIEYVPDDFKLPVIKKYKEFFENKPKEFYNYLYSDSIKNNKVKEEVKKFLGHEIKESYNLLESEFNLSEIDSEKIYKVFKNSYDKSTGSSWDYNKFLQRSADWKFFGNTEGFVTVRVQKSGFWKITSCAGNPKGILKGLDELLSKNVPLWTAASGELSEMLKKKGFIVFKGMLYGFAIKKFVEGIDKSVFGDDIEKVESDGGIIFNIDGKKFKKYFCCNKEYLKSVLKSDKVPETVKKILGSFL